MTPIEALLDTHQKVVEDGFTKSGGMKYRTYAISTLRGGVGKSTLAFNLSYELATAKSMLVADLCPQCNLTETLMPDKVPEVSILSALQPILLGPAFGESPADLAYRISTYCDAFKPVRTSHIIPGDPLMFAFPSTLYQQLQTAHSQNKPPAVKALLECLKTVLERESAEKGSKGILLDTSPFYAGGTHLAWCAADAVIIPVRVDEHSLASLELTLDLLSNPQRDFCMWNDRAGGRPSPKVAAIVMTMVGSKSQMRATPDRASIMYVERALDIAAKYPQLFDHQNPADSFVITDDLFLQDELGGAKSIPISQLKIGSFHMVEGKRLQVNSSATRYQRELAYLMSII